MQLLFHINWPCLLVMLVQFLADTEKNGNGIAVACTQLFLGTQVTLTPEWDVSGD